MSVTDIIALYAALLSTVVFFWQWKSNRPNIKVVVVCALEDGQTGCHIAIQNLSSHTVHVGAVTLLYPWRKVGVMAKIMDACVHRRLDRRPGWVLSSLRNYGFDNCFPCEVAAHNSVGIFVPQSVLETVFFNATRREIIVQVQDAVWRNYCSDVFRDIAR